MKSYFTHYSFVVFILFNTGLCKSAFSTNKFRKLFFYRSVLFVFSAYYVSIWCNLHRLYNICTIFVWSRNMRFCSHLSLVQMKDKIVSSCLILKQNSFKLLKQVCSHLQQNRFKCFRQFKKMHFKKIVKQKQETVSTENRNSH